MSTRLPASVAKAYDSAPKTHQATMLEMRKRILEVIPDATEVIKYGMPTFVVDGNAVAGLLANKNHIGYYPYSGSLLARFPEITARYAHTKGALHIPIDEPLPKDLVRKLIRARISDCPVVSRKTAPADSEYWAKVGLPAPARRALVNAGITTLVLLAKRTRDEVAALHGMGPKALGILDRELTAAKKRWK